MNHLCLKKTKLIDFSSKPEIQLFLDQLGFFLGVEITGIQAERNILSHCCEGSHNCVFHALSWLQMIMRRGRPLANDYPVFATFCNAF